MRGIGPVLVYCFIGLCLGIGLAEWGDARWLAVVLAACLFVLVLRRDRWLLLVVAAAIGGFLLWQHAHPQAPGLVPDRYISCRARVLDNPSTKEDSTRFTVRVEEQEVSYRVVCQFKAGVERGDLVFLRGVRREIRPPSNPGEFNYREYFAHRGVFFNLIVNEPSGFRILSRQGGALFEIGQAVVSRGVRAIRPSMGERAAVLLEGMLFGLQGDIGPEDYALFQRTGLVHIFSVSGFHVGFVVGLGALLAGALRLRRGYRLLLVGGFIAAYGCMANWPVPLLRAAIMAWAGLAAVYVGRRQDLTASLCLAGIILLLANPACFFEISFQLSFLATWGLVYLYPRWAERLGARQVWMKGVLLTLAPQVAVLPLAAAYYNLVSLVSVAANLVLVNVAGLAVVLGFIGTAAAQLGQAAGILFMIPAGLATEAVAWGAEVFSRVPGGYLWVSSTGPLVVALAYAGLLLAWSGREMAKTRRAGLVMLAVFACCLVLPGQYRNPGVLKVVFLDVGQGDCIFIKTPGGRTVLVDGGGAETYDVGGKVVLPFLRRQGITRIDLVIATHPHVDHVAGLIPVLKEMSVGMTVGGRGCGQALAGNRVLEIEGQSRLNLDRRTTLYLWSPSSGEGNDASLVSRVECGSDSFLLPGDAEMEELQLLLREQPFSLSSTVVKAPHHGSGGSWNQDFAAAAAPRCVVVQVGRRNPFGHPSPAVLAGWKDSGCRVFRTDQDGAVSFVSTSSGLQIRRECPQGGDSGVSPLGRP